MTVNVDDNHFSSKSSASRFLAKALRERNNDAIARKTLKIFEEYILGFTEICKMNDPPRSKVLQLWYEHGLAKAEQKLKKNYEDHDLPFHEFSNLLMHRYREAILHGNLLQRLRE